MLKFKIPNHVKLKICRSVLKNNNKLKLKFTISFIFSMLCFRTPRSEKTNTIIICCRNKTKWYMI